MMFLAHYKRSQVFFIFNLTWKVISLTVQLAVKIISPFSEALHSYTGIYHLFIECIKIEWKNVL